MLVTLSFSSDHLRVVTFFMKKIARGVVIKQYLRQVPPLASWEGNMKYTIITLFF